MNGNNEQWKVTATAVKGQKWYVGQFDPGKSHLPLASPLNTGNWNTFYVWVRYFLKFGAEKNSLDSESVYTSPS